jgi:F420-non-reducing hydrogenase iron-sulfur subunit
MSRNVKSQITLFHCINTFTDSVSLPLPAETDLELKTVKMACSSMVKDVFLLRAFESGSDAVVVMVCPEGQCRYIEGNIRAKKRVGWVKKILDEIGLDGKRLSLHNIASGDIDAAAKIIRQVVSDLKDLGPSPAR